MIYFDLDDVMSILRARGYLIHGKGVVMFFTIDNENDRIKFIYDGSFWKAVYDIEYDNGELRRYSSSTGENRHFEDAVDELRMELNGDDVDYVTEWALNEVNSLKLNLMRKLVNSVFCMARVIVDKKGGFTKFIGSGYDVTLHVNENMTYSLFSHYNKEICHSGFACKYLYDAMYQLYVMEMESDSSIVSSWIERAIKRYRSLE